MIKPLNNKVLLRILTVPQKEVAGLIIQNAKEATERGVVMALPSNDRELLVGDEVLIKTGAGQTVPEGRLVSRDEILGVYA